MINLLGLSRPQKGTKITIEYCPQKITMPYKVKKLINKASLTVPTNQTNKPKCKQDPFGFTEKVVRVGEFLNEYQVQHLVDQAHSSKSGFDSIEIVEGAVIGPDLLQD
jgi:hypothetical protein